MKTIEKNDINKPVRFSELNNNQKQVYILVQEETDNYIGGLENSLDDEEEGSEEWQRSHDELYNTDRQYKIDYILSEIRLSRIWKLNEQLHFVSLDWVKARINKRLARYGY